MKFFLKVIGNYIYKRACEASTWRNVVLLIGGTYALEHPDLVEAIIPVCIAIAGLIGSFFPDIIGKQSSTNQKLPEIDLISKSENYNNDVSETDNDYINNDDDNVVSENTPNKLSSNNRNRQTTISKRTTKEIEHDEFGFNDK